jgi:hypothetical protein
MASMFLVTFVSICSTVGRGWIADAVGHFDNARIAQLNILVMEYGLSAAIVIMAVSAGAKHIRTRLFAA